MTLRTKGISQTWLEQPTPLTSTVSIPTGFSGTTGVDLAVFQSLLHELGKPFLTENTILKVLQVLILKCLATGCNLEQTFGQDVPSDLGGLKGRHSGATLLKGHC